jgi:hypothetical protein
MEGGLGGSSLIVPARPPPLHHHRGRLPPAPLRVLAALGHRVAPKGRSSLGLGPEQGAIRSCSCASNPRSYLGTVREGQPSARLCSFSTPRIQSTPSREPRRLAVPTETRDESLHGPLLLLISALIKMRARSSTQLPLSFRQHGGSRAGAGRKPGPGRRNVRHRARAKVASRFPVLVTLRAERGVGNLRRKRAFRPIHRVFGDVAAAAEAGAAFRVVHYSVQKDHIHLLVEAKDRSALSRGMQGLGIRMAKALNRALGRQHGVMPPRAPRRWVDPCSSAPWFDGWRGPVVLPTGDAPRPATGPPVAAPRTWLLSVGWRRHGLLVPWRGAGG